MRKLLLPLLLLLFVMCKRDDSVIHNNQYAVKLKSDLAFLSGVVKDNVNGNLLINASNYYTTENIIRLFVVDPLSKKIIAEDSTFNATTGSICSSGGDFYVTHGQQFRQDSIPLLLTRYDRMLNKTKSVTLANLFFVNLFYAATCTLPDGSIACAVTGTLSDPFIQYFHYDQELQLIKKVSSGNALNNYNNPVITAIKPLNDGDFLIAIATRSTLNKWALLMERRDKNFQLIWSKTVHEPGNIYPSDLCVEPNGSFWMVGSFIPSIATTPEYDPMVMKFDANGNLVKKYYEPTTWSETRGSTGVTTTDGGLIFTIRSNEGKGTNYSTILTKLDANANPVWRKKFGGSKNTALRPFLFSELAGKHLLTYFDNSFFNASEGYNLVLNYIDDEGEILE